MNNIIESTLLTLKKSRNLLTKLSNIELSDATVSPYYSSIGSHIRHIYDFYNCLLEFNEEGKVDLTLRRRNLEAQTCCNSAINYYEDIINRLMLFDYTKKQSIIVIDDLGLGNINIDYTFDALLAHANSHTIHHYAIIGYILDRLGISIDDSDFGLNATTPKKTIKLN